MPRLPKQQPIWPPENAPHTQTPKLASLKVRRKLATMMVLVGHVITEPEHCFGRALLQRGARLRPSPRPATDSPSASRSFPHRPRVRGITGLVDL